MHSVVIDTLELKWNKLVTRSVPSQWAGKNCWTELVKITTCEVLDFQVDTRTDTYRVQDITHTNHPPKPHAFTLCIIPLLQVVSRSQTLTRIKVRETTRNLKYVATTTRVLVHKLTSRFYTLSPVHFLHQLRNTISLQDSTKTVVRWVRHETRQTFL